MKAAPLILISPSFQPSGAEFADPSLSLSNYYCAAIHSAGGVPVVMPRIADRKTVAELVRRSDGVMISGGDDIQPALYREAVPKDLAATVHETDPDRDWIELVLIDELFRQRKPLLAICRGHQILNVALGGTLFVDIALQVPGALPHSQPTHKDKIIHEVTLTKRSQIGMICRSEILGVNTSHHQSVDRVAELLRVTAWSSDGVVEGLELKESEAALLPFLLAVQFHPERLFNRHPAHKRIFERFVQQCAATE
ncbi:MAG: type 1 glutamine amidotransferase [Opitutaceae bacterium]|nr:type 1 glutamine amidotransferase [Verrucomicrobiales bacterium]